MRSTRTLKVICFACLAGALFVCLRPAQTQQAAARPAGKGPNLGFDYRAIISEHQGLLNTGEAEKAAELLRNRAKFPKAFEAGADDLKKKFALIYGAAGKHDRHEVSGYKRLSSSLYLFTVISHYDNVIMQFNYGFERHQGEWKLLIFGMADNPDLMFQNMPFQPIEDK